MKGGDAMQVENIQQKGLGVAVVGLSMLVGVVAGSTLLTAHQSNAQTTTPAAQVTTAPSQTGDGQNNGTSQHTFKSNENPTHEAHESAAREAQENAGQIPTVK